MVMTLAGGSANWQNAVSRLSSRPTLARLPPNAAIMTGYIARLWRGQLGLAQSCGMNGVLVILPLAIWARNDAEHPPTSLAALAVSTLLPLVFVFALGILSAVGIWRSTLRRPVVGRRTSAWAARIAQVLVVANVILAIATGARLVGDMRMLGAAHPQPAQGYEVTLRGNTAVFSGRMNTAAAGELELLLSDTSVKRLAIARSAGGDVRSTAKLVNLIRARKLFVVALANCDAACTALLTAGDVRAIVPQTVLNFGARPEPALRSLIAADIVTTIFDAQTKRYVRASVWCAHNPVVCARTGSQNAQTRTRGDGSHGA